KIAVWLLEVVGQFETRSLTHVYVPRKVTRSLYWTVETDGAPRVKLRVAAAAAAGPISAAASTAIWAVARNRTRLRPRICLHAPGSIERTGVDGPISRVCSSWSYPSNVRSGPLHACTGPVHRRTRPGHARGAETAATGGGEAVAFPAGGGCSG